ncbi:MAG: D-alanyl-D-alanine carboxypeptidase/D-alanyl-D-alanine-endopeptidase [Myxococcota bacterium]|nr:D-alanyl-D-alanine carboxypeptidase/D-alanyl-D-alanine-endopeptidase [Myxococcota bacterium]
MVILKLPHWCIFFTLGLLWLPPLSAQTKLQSQVMELLKSPVLAGADVGLEVKNLQSGEELFALNKNRLMIPASNIKIITTGAALYYLLPDYKFYTVIYGDMDDEGVVAGDLWIKGHGDPWLLPEKVWYIITQLKRLGLKKVRGRIIADGSYFAPPHHARGSEQDSSSAAYMSPAGGLSVGFNAMGIHIKPAKQIGQPALISFEPSNHYVQTEGHIMTVSDQTSKILVDTVNEPDKSTVWLSGRINSEDKPKVKWRKVSPAALYAGEIFKALMQEQGIEIAGKVEQGFVPEEAPEIFKYGSLPLSEIVLKVNQFSNNFMAAQLARVLGAEVMGVPGTWSKGVQVMDAFLDKMGIASGTYVLGNASGLHDVNAFSVGQISQVLEFMYNQRHLRTEFLASMAVAGSSGTLKERMRQAEAQYYLRGKTGTLSSASALSGYVVNKDGEDLVFAFIVNHYRSPLVDVWGLQDKLGNLLAGSSRDSALVVGARSNP